MSIKSYVVYTGGISAVFLVIRLVCLSEQILVYFNQFSCQHSSSHGHVLLMLYVRKCDLKLCTRVTTEIVRWALSTDKRQLTYTQYCVLKCPV